MLYVQLNIHHIISYSLVYITYCSHGFDVHEIIYRDVHNSNRAEQEEGSWDWGLADKVTFFVNEKGP